MFSAKTVAETWRAYVARLALASAALVRYLRVAYGDRGDLKQPMSKQTSHGPTQTYKQLGADQLARFAVSDVIRGYATGSTDLTTPEPRSNGRRHARTSGSKLPHPPRPPNLSLRVLPTGILDTDAREASRIGAARHEAYSRRAPAVGELLVGCVSTRPRDAVGSRGDEPPARPSG